MCVGGGMCVWVTLHMYIDYPCQRIGCKWMNSYLDSAFRFIKRVVRLHRAEKRDADIHVTCVQCFYVCDSSA